MQSAADKALAWAGAMLLPIALTGCAMTKPIPPACPAVPAPLVSQQAESKAFSDGYRAGALAQALRDQARARRELEALNKSLDGPLLLLPPIALPPLSPTPDDSPQDSTTPAGPAVPLNNKWLPY